MRSGLPFPLLWLALVAMWLVLNGTITLAQAILGMIVALGAVLGLRAVGRPSKAPHRPLAALALASVVVYDILHSNVAVAAIVLSGRRHGRAGFVEIPLELRHPTGLAVLACIITATPGTSWAGYDSRAGVLTMHILDLVDDATSIRAIKGRYERRLMEIFE
ncbi:MAG TPA: Na+/H+ antiporter subunit E [Casimicrobiaceae bacterium]|nr:Na+/H+ antiporter subunit E [Casimicrobiaceae bacterium]HXU65745.1 Na+/H+ antiporter subunit E [Casimicrobiaceae bacterium]